MAAELKELYGDIDAVELFVGFMLEKRRSKQLFGDMITEMGSPYSLKGKDNARPARTPINKNIYL